MTNIASNIVGAVLFGVLLMAGLLVDSKATWGYVMDGGMDTVLFLPLTFLSFTPTNLLGVAIVAAFFSDKIVARTTDASGVTWYASVGIGVGVWFGFLVSQVGSPQALLSATQEQYFVFLSLVGCAALGISTAATTAVNRRAELHAPVVYTRRPE